jgi:Domain of unknown function (DUF4132)
MFFNALARVLARMTARRFAKFPTETTESLLEWVRNGTPTEALEELRKHPHIPTAFIEDGSVFLQDIHEHRLLISAFAELPDAQALRFGALLVAVYGNPSISAPHRLALPADAIWVELLVRVARAQVNVSTSVNAIDSIPGLDFAHLSRLLFLAGHSQDTLLRAVNNGKSCLGVPEFRVFWCTMPGYKETSHAHVETLRACLLSDPRTAAATLRTLSIATPELFEPLADSIATLAGSDDLHVRCALAMAARRGGDSLRAALERAGWALIVAASPVLRPVQAVKLANEPSGQSKADDQRLSALVEAVSRVAREALDSVQVAARGRSKDGSQGAIPVEPDDALRARLLMALENNQIGSTRDASRCSIAMRDFLPAFLNDAAGSFASLAELMCCVHALDPQIAGDVSAIDGLIGAYLSIHRNREKPDLGSVREHLAKLGIRSDALVRRMCDRDIAHYVARWPTEALQPLIGDFDEVWRLPLETLLEDFQHSPDGHPLADLLGRVKPLPDALAEYLLEIALAPPAKRDPARPGQELGRARAARRALTKADPYLDKRLILVSTRSHIASALAAKTWIEERRHASVPLQQLSPSETAAWISEQTLRLRELDLSSGDCAESAIREIAKVESAASVHLLRMLAEERINGLKGQPWPRANAALYMLAERRSMAVDALFDLSVPVAGFGQPGIPPLSELLSIERTRLQAAMDLGRRWYAQDWCNGIAKHLLLGRLARGLVWLLLDDQRLIASFRPDAKGVPRDVDGFEIKFDEASQIVLAHQSLLDEATIETWVKANLHDGIKPAFRQFGRLQPNISDDLKWAQEIAHFKGQRVPRSRFDAQMASSGYEARVLTENGYCLYEHTVGHSVAHRVNLEVEREGSEVVLGSLTFRSSTFPELATARTSGPIGHWVPPILLAERCSDLAELLDEAKAPPLEAPSQALPVVQASDRLLIDADLSAESLKTAAEFLASALSVLERLRPTVEGDWSSPLKLVDSTLDSSDNGLSVRSFPSGVILEMQRHRRFYERELRLVGIGSDVSPIGRACTALQLPPDGVGPAMLNLAAEALSLFGTTWVVRAGVKTGAKPEKLHSRQTLRELIGSGCYGSENADVVRYARYFDNDARLSSRPINHFWGDGAETLLEAINNWHAGQVAAKLGMEGGKRNDDLLAAKIWAWAPKRMLIRRPEYPNARLRAVATAWHLEELPLHASNLRTRTRAGES